MLSVSNRSLQMAFLFFQLNTDKYIFLLQPTYPCIKHVFKIYFPQEGNGNAKSTLHLAIVLFFPLIFVFFIKYLTDFQDTIFHCSCVIFQKNFIYNTIAIIFCNGNIIAFTRNHFQHTQCSFSFYLLFVYLFSSKIITQR